MTSVSTEASHEMPASASAPVWSRLLRLALLVVGDAAVIWFLIKLFALGYYPLAATILVIALFVNVVLLLREAYPLRWC